MKTIGLLGGLTFESSLVYYRLINELAREKLGGNHSAESVMVSVDFGRVQPLTERGDWQGVLETMTEAARKIERAGADFLVICANTIHKLAEEIEQSIAIPLLHIVDTTAGEVKKSGLRKVGLLGTRFTMEEQFFVSRLRESHRIEVLVPEKEERELIHGVIINELARGVIDSGSRESFRSIIEGLARKGAQGVILGCTELPLLIGPDDVALPLFDTLELHARAAVEYALAD